MNAGTSFTQSTLNIFNLKIQIKYVVNDNFRDELVKIKNSMIVRRPEKMQHLFLAATLFILDEQYIWWWCYLQ